MKAHEEYEQMVNELETLRAENAKLIAERDDLLAEQIAYGSVCDSLLTLGDELRKLRAERDMYKNNCVAYECNCVSCKTVFLGEKEQHICFKCLLAEREQWMKQEPELPAPYAQIEIDVDTGCRVVDTPSYKTVAVYSAYQVRQLLKAHPLPAQQSTFQHLTGETPFMTFDPPLEVKEGETVWLPMGLPAKQVAVLEGLEIAAKYIEQKVKNYITEHGNFDSSTGSTEFPKGGEDYINEMEELAEEILALSAAPKPEDKCSLSDKEKSDATKQMIDDMNGLIEG